MKKTKPLIIIMVFILTVIMPFVKVDAVTHTVEISNPHNTESFSYFTTNEVFEAYSITGGLDAETNYQYFYYWYIDSNLIDNGNGWKLSSRGGVIILDDEFDTTVDVSTFDVGVHDTKLKVTIIDTPNHIDDHTHEWTRGSPPPEYTPSVTFTNPEVPTTAYNFSAEGTDYEVAFTIEDIDDNIVTMYLFLDGVYQDDWNPNPPKGDYDCGVTIDSEKVYTIKVNGTDEDFNDYSETTYLLAYNTSQYIDVIDPEGQYHNSEIRFKITSGAPNNLNNLSYSVEDYSFADSSVISQYSNESLLGGQIYTYGLNWSDFVDSVSFDYGTKWGTKTDWYNSAWDYRLLINISSTDVQTDYAMNITIVVADSVYDDDKADGDDWVVTESDGSTICKHWLERYDDSGSSQLWFQCDLSSGYNAFYLYYGNVAASNSEDPSNIFDYWDGFEDYTTGNSPTGWEIINDEHGNIEASETVVLHGSKSLLFEDTSGTSYPTGEDDQMGLDLLDGYYFSYWFYTTDDSEEGHIYYSEGSTWEGGNVQFGGTTAGKLEYYDGAVKQICSFSGTTWYQIIVMFDGVNDYSQWVYDVSGSLVGSVLNAATRDTPTDIDMIKVSAGGGATTSVAYLDSMKVWDKVANKPTYTKDGSEDSWEVDPTIVVTETPDTTGITTIGDNYNVTLSTAVASKIVFNITYTINDTVFVVYSTSSNIVQTNSFTLNDSAWDSLSDGWFNVNVSCFDDLDSYYSANLTYYLDTTSPMVWLYSPENRTRDDPYSNLQIIPLSYKINDTVDTGKWSNDMKWLIIDEEYFTGDDWVMYPKHSPLIFYQGFHNLTVGARDRAGNEDEMTARFYYEERLEKPLELRFSSSIDDETINPEQYLSIYLDGMPISATSTTNLNEFTVTVYDKFGILLNSTAYNYTSVINMELPLRPVVFENNNEIICKYKISYNLFEKSFWVVAGENQTYYLNDTTYNLVGEAGDEYYNETHWYGQTYIQFTVESGMSAIEVTLDLISDDPLHQPLRITIYDKELDIDGGYIYIYYETSWGNISIRVKDNTTWLGSLKSEGWTIWIFDLNDYGLHNITIFMSNDGEGDVIFSDGFSFILEEPEAEPNYYLSITTSIDADGGLFYVTINTYWDNCTIRVKDNTTWLGSAVDEGSSVWQFDEETYGLHIFNISVYQDGVLWDSIITSITIMEPDADVLSFNHYSVQFDADAGHVYLNYQTNWGNTTCQVKDNSTWLSVATGEGISIWTFITDIGFHNITVVINSSSTEWFIDVFSFTITLPEQIWQEVLFTFTSSYDSQTIDSNEYLQVFLNNALVSAGTSTYLSVFNISIYNNFNQLLYNYTNYPYAATIAIQLALRNVTFYNPNTISCEYQIWQGTEYVQMWISPLTYSNYYLYDSNYTVLCNPSDIDAGNGYEYISTTVSFEVVVGMSNIEVTLDTQQVVIIYRPITIRAISLNTREAISQWYLKYYLDGILSLEGATTETANLTIQLCVTDVFGNVLYNQSVAYSRYVDITVPLRWCMFRNKETTSTTLTITQEGSEEHLFFMIGVSSYIRVYLADSTYNLVHAPTSPDKGGGVMYVAETYTFTCSLSSQSLDLWLGEFEVMPPLLDPYPIHNRWAIIAAVGVGSLNFVCLVFAIGVIVTRIPKKEEKEF